MLTHDPSPDSPPGDASGEALPAPKAPTEAQNLKLPADLRAELHRVSIDTGISISKIAADGIRLRLNQLSAMPRAADA